MFLATDRPHALRQAISACRKGGTVSIPGVYGGWLDKFPLGAAFAKGLTLKMGQTHMHKYMPILLERIERGEIDPSFIITHRIGLEDAPAMYRTFRDKDDSCIKVVMKPGAAAHVDKRLLLTINGYLCRMLADRFSQDTIHVRALSVELPDEGET